jgi:Membrane protein involved in colicin uptake
VSEHVEETDDQESDNAAADNERNVLDLDDTDSIDETMIPPEAHHCARLYLSSIKSRVYASSNSCLSEKYKVCKNEFIDQRSVCAIVGLGRVVEIPIMSPRPMETHNNDDNEESIVHEQGMISETNDREALLEAREYFSNPQSPMVPCVDLVRCAQLSENCIAVSWGMDDGIVVIYRRVKFDDGKFGWHSIAMVSPQEDVIDSVGDACTMARIVGSSQMERRTFIHESGLLRVSEMIPLHLAPHCQVENHTILVVSRLGGYLEFITIPNEVCQGPLIRPRQKKLRGCGHYASRLPNISEDRRLNHGWLSTREVQLDITSLAIINTNESIKNSSHMDCLSMEYMICTSGMSTTSLFENANGCKSPQTRVPGCECLALWRFSMEPGGNDKKYSMQFNLLDHSQFPQVGPDVSIFASKRTISNWVPNAKGSCPIPITIAPPISDIQMSSLSTSNSVFISILHYNGLSTSLNYRRDSSMSTFDNTKGCCRLRILREKEESVNQLMQNHDSIITIGWWCTENILYLVQGTSKGYLMLKQVCDSNSDVIDFWITTSVRHPVSNTSIITKSFPQTQITILGCKTTKNEGSIMLYRVGQLCLTNYIHSLVSQENLEEASELAKFGNLTVANVPVVEKLRVHLWEKRFDVESFKMISDDKYVIQQAYSLDELVRQKSSIGTDVMHNILEEALLRITAVESKNRLFDQTVKTKIINDLTYLGTYIRLSQLLDLKNVSASRFIEKFLPIDVMSLAKSFAAHGDMRSVCLIVSRHAQFWESITIMIEVLNCLPLSIPIRDFEMLLPDAINTSMEQWWSKITDFAENYLSLQIFDGISEKRNIEEAICNNGQHSFRDDFNLIAWYLQRAKLMASSFGLLELTVLFLNKAIETIGEETVDERSENIILEIISLRACLYHMHSIVELGMCLDTVLIQRMQAMSVREFESLGVSGAIELILGSCKEEQEFTFRYKEILHPMFSLDDLGPDYVMRCWPDLVTGEPCYNFDRKKELELGIVLFCLKNLQNSIENDTFNDNGSTQSALTALALCEVLVKGSSTKIPVQERIIGDTLILMQFVLDVAKTIGVNLSSYHIEVLWRLYECIPAFYYSMTDDDGWKCLSQSIDSLYRTLLGLDLCQRWIDKHKILPVTLDELYDGHQMWSSEPNLQSSTLALARFGSKLLHSMCEGFIKKCKELSDADLNILFLCFMSDVYDLNDYSCHGLLDVEDAFSIHLVNPLLEAHSFDMLRKFLLTGCVSKRLICTSIETFAKDLTSITDGDGFVHLISLCRYYFGDTSPECSSTLKAIHNAFVSLPFVKNNAYGSRSTLSSLDFKRSPISSIIYVLENEPHMITLQDPDCAESWFSSSAIAEVLNKFKNVKNDSYLDDLSFPSFAVLKVANNLGLRDPHSQIIVKGLIAKFACYHGMHAIALVICTIMLFNVVSAERTCSRVDDTEEEFLLKHISSATSLSCLTHPDIVNDLCRRTICWWNPQRCRADTVDHFINILRLCSLTKIEREEHKIYEVPGFEATEKILSTIISVMNQVDRHSISLVSISDMHTKDVMDRILAWSAGSWFSFNKDKRHQKFTVLELWLYMVFVLNLLDVGPETSLSYCLQEIERSEKSVINSMSYEKPSKTIVDKLVHLGYTANAAQRASINTDNQNASAALLWAVAHANDADFNDPLPILKKQTDPSYDRYLLQENLILPKQMIHNALNYITKFKLTNRNCNQSTVRICGKDHQNDKGKSLSLFDKQILISTKCTNGHSTMTVQNRTSLNSGSFDERKQGNGGRQLLLERGNISLLAAQGRKLLERAKGKSTLVPSTLKGTERLQEVIKEHTCVAKEDALIKGEKRTFNAESLCKQAETRGKQQTQWRETEQAETIRETSYAKQKHAAQEAERLQMKVKEQGAERLRKILEEEQKCAAEDDELKKREEDEEAERLRWELEEQQKRAADGSERLRKQAEEEHKRAAEEAERILRKQAEEAEVERLRMQAEEEQAERLRKQAEEEQKLAAEEAERLRKIAEEEQKRAAEEAERLRKQAEEEEAEKLRKILEEEQKLAAEEAERLRKQAEEEQAERIRRKAGEEQAERLRKQAEEEEQKLAAEEAERLRKIAEEEEAERLQKQAEEEQAERLRKQAEEEQKRAAEEAERLRMQAVEEETERLRKKAEEEEVVRLRKQAEEEQKRAIEEAAQIKRQEEEEPERICKVVEEEQERAQSLNCTLEQKELVFKSNGDEVCLGEDKDGWSFDQDSIGLQSSISLSSPFKPSSSTSENTSRAPYFTSSNHVEASPDLLYTRSNDIPRSDLDDSDNEGWDFDF